MWMNLESSCDPWTFQIQFEITEYIASRELFIALLISSVDAPLRYVALERTSLELAKVPPLPVKYCASFRNL